MDIENAKIGMRVRISFDISTTTKLYSSGSTMRSMKGKEYTIQSIGENRIWIQDYIWHPNDIIDLSEEKEKESQLFIFDENFL